MSAESPEITKTPQHDHEPTYRRTDSDFKEPSQKAHRRMTNLRQRKHLHGRFNLQKKCRMKKKKERKKKILQHSCKGKIRRVRRQYTNLIFGEQTLQWQ